MMKNKEKYKKDFIERDICDKASPWRDAICHGKKCKGCPGRFIEWSEQEAMPDLTMLEEEVLKRIGQPFKYIARDEDGKLFVYYQKPRKGNSMWMSDYHHGHLPLTGLFDWITFDDKKPRRIDDFVKRND